MDILGGITKLADFIRQYPVWVQIFFLCTVCLVLISVFLAIAFHPGGFLQKQDNAIFLKRIISEEEDGKQKLTIYLSAAGEDIFIVDSLTIEHQPMLTAFFDTGPRPSDAQYVFPFKYGSSMLKPLDPALVLNPEDDVEVFVSLELVPVEEAGGEVSAAINYHLEKAGLRGVLKLQDVPEEGRFLASLAGKDVEYEGMLITPEGLQRGQNDGVEKKLWLTYERLELPVYGYYSTELQDRPVLELSEDRQKINELIRKKKAIPRIIERVNEGDMLAFDLCIGLNEPECGNALLKVGMVQEYLNLAAGALAVRHILYPGNDLANFVLNPKVKLNEIEYSHISEIATVLFYYPRGSWVDAMIKLIEYDLSTIDGIYVRREQLSEEHRVKVEAFCFAKLQNGYPESAKQFLIWRGYSEEEIMERTQKN